MKFNILSNAYIVGFLFCSLTGHAQKTPDDTDSIKVDMGFGIIQDRALSTAATATIYAEELQKTAAISLQDALYGRLPGLTALKRGGFAGDNGYGASFNIRGTQTLSETGILILVDGFERPIDRLSVDEVESVTLLKDAASVALYGHRGINGAILVKTKRGQVGKRVIDISYDHKFTFDPKIPEFADAFTYAGALNEAHANDGLTPAYNQYELDAFKNNTYPSIYPNVDWKKEALKKSGSEDRLNLAISGGNEKMKYYTLLNYTDSRGLLNNTGMNDGYSTQLKYSKANIRANLDFQITSTTLMQVNAQGTFIETNRPGGASAYDVFNSLYTIPSSAYPVRTDNGLWGGTTTNGASNLVAKIQNTGYGKTHARAFYTDAKLTQRLDFWLEGLSASARLGYDNYSEIYEQRKRGFAYASERYLFDTNGKVIGSTPNSGGNKTDNLEWSKWLSGQWRRANFVFTLDYKKSIGENNLMGSILYTTDAYTGNGRFNTFKRANWSAYFHYDWQEKYVADLALVLSGSNRSYPETFAFSPTVSAAWIISKEDFLKDNSLIDLLKLRGSFGIQHTDYVPRTGLSFEDYSGGSGDYFFGSGYNRNWGFFLGYLPTTSFKLETANKYNLGLDISLLKALNFSLDAYYQRRSNILLSGDGLNSDVIGIPSAYVNKGKVDSKGIEISLNYNKQIRDFSISAGAIFTYGTNEVKDLIETPAYPHLSKIGKLVDQPWGLEAIGFFKDQADIDASNRQEFAIVKPGDIKYKDQNGDGIINENDEIAMGYSTNAPQINYSFNVGLEYKGIGFNVLFQGAGNYTQYLRTTGVYTPLVNNTNLALHYLENCWRAGQDNSNALYPRLTSENSPNNYRANSIWLSNVSFLKLRNCELYYKLPARWLAKTFISDTRIYVKGENLLSIDNLDVMDPENIEASYPTLKAVNVGISLKF